MKNKLSIVIPTYNERMNIIPLIESIMAVIGESRHGYEVIVVDDNSPDKTATALKESFRANRNIRVFKRTGGRGLASAILFGIKKSKGDIIVGMDADFNHPPEKIPDLIGGLDKSDLVIASRFLPEGGMDDKIRYFFTLAFNLFLKYALGFPTSDNMSGFYAIEKIKLLDLPIETIYEGYGEYHLRLVYLAAKRNLTIGEIPVYYKSRIHGKSKSNLMAMFFQYLKIAFELKIKNNV